MTLDDDFRIGVSDIDDQHDEILQKIEELKTTDNPAAVARILLAYVGKHFDDEERVMQRIGYTGYKEHKQIHDNFRKKVVHIVAQIDKPGMLKKLQLYTSAWIVEHIQTEDAHLGRAIKEFTDTVFDGIPLDPKYLDV